MPKQSKPKASKTPPAPAMSECDRMVAIHDQSQVIGEFLDWLAQVKHFTLCERHEHTDDCYSEGLTPEQFREKHAPKKNEKPYMGFYDNGLTVVELRNGRFARPKCGYRDRDFFPVGLDIEKLLAEYFKIDLKKVDAERRQMLDHLHRRQRGMP